MVQSDCAREKAEKWVNSLWKYFLLMRVCYSFMQKTYAHPDEYWQGLEMSHKMVFGYGLQSWEWEPENALRSPMHPYVFALVYKALALLRLDHTYLFVLVPKNLVQPLIASLWDFYLLKLAIQLDLLPHLSTIVLLLSHSSSWSTSSPSAVSPSPPACTPTSWKASCSPSPSTTGSRHPARNQTNSNLALH